jgi:hypothetical protein
VIVNLKTVPILLLLGCAGTVCGYPNVRFWQILLEKSKIEQLGKSREGRLLGPSTDARLCKTNTKVRGRFCVNRCGPSRRGVQNASAVLKKFGPSAEKDFFNNIE